ncbi:MAG: hypothetical protein JO247_11485, partial [Chloroflexi bacterium]|nr:hypothetical protein [Chloroflexota bacterium]
MRVPRFLRRWFIAPALAITLGACGGSQAASPAGSPSASAPPSASAAPMLSAAPLAANLKPGQYYHPAVLNLATIGNNEQGTEERMAPVVDYLSKTVGLKINYVQTTSYSSV